MYDELVVAIVMGLVFIVMGTIATVRVFKDYKPEKDNKNK